MTSKRLTYMAKISDSLYKILDVEGGKGPTLEAASIVSVGEYL